MANLNSPLVLLAGVLCFVTFAAVTDADAITVEGKVYCDTCRLGFETFATYYIPGARVKLACVNKESRKVTFTGQGETDGTGTYRVQVPGEHEEDLCNVYLVSSPVKGCDEVQAGREHGIVVLTSNNGIVSGTRYASPLGFFKAEPLASCPDVVKKYHF